MISLKFTLRTARKKPDNTYPIYLRLYENYKPKFISTGLSVSVEYWNQKTGRVRKGHPSSDAFNAKLDDIMSDAQSELIRLSRDGNITLDQFSAHIISGTRVTYFENVAEDFIKIMEQTSTRHPTRRTRHALVKFREFRKDKLTTFGEIDTQMLSGFVKWLQKDRNNGNNTIVKDLESFKRIFNHALNEKYIRSLPEFPKVKREDPERKIKLNQEQVNRIINLDLEAYSPIWNVRNYWLFSYFYVGIRWIDICKLTWSNIKDGRIVYKAEKTKKHHVAFPMNKVMLEILDYYKKPEQKPNDFVFPILPVGFDYSNEDVFESKYRSQNAIVNLLLKKLARIAGIDEKLSFHVSRHSAAARLKNTGADVYSVQKAMRHSSIRVTEDYLRGLDDVQLENALIRAFGE